MFSPDKHKRFKRIGADYGADYSKKPNQNWNWKRGTKGWGWDFRFGLGRGAGAHTYNPHTLYNSPIFLEDNTERAYYVKHFLLRYTESVQQGANASAYTIVKSIVMADSW